LRIAAAFAGGSDACAMVGRMVAAMRSEPWHTATHGPAQAAPSGALGSVVVSDRFSAIPSSWEAPSGNRLLVSGVPIDVSGSVAERLRQAVSAPLPEAIRLLQGLDGVFAAILWHVVERKLVVVTDMLGVQPLYMHRRQGLLILASETKAFAASGAVPIRMNPAAWGAFIAVRHTIADMTLVDGVDRVPAGSTLIYDADADDLTSSAHWSWPAPGRFERVEDVPTGDIVDALLAEIRGYQQHHADAVITLSGGHDSRLLLASVVGTGHRPRALTLSHPDEFFNFEARVAKRLAALHDVPLTIVRPPRFFASDAYLWYLSAHELASPSLELSIPLLSGVLDAQLGAIWEGLFLGNMLSPASQTAGGFAPYLAKMVLGHDHQQWQVARQVFAPHVVDAMRTGFTEALTNEISRYADDQFGVAQFMARNRMRHRTGPNPSQAFNAKVLAFTPGGSRASWNAVASVPFELRRDHRLYRHLLERHYPKTLTAPALSGAKLFAAKGGRDLDYYRAAVWNRMIYSPLVPLASRVGWMRPYGAGDDTPLVSEAVARLEPGHDDLNADGIRTIQRAPMPLDNPMRAARRLAFYWESWRRMMDGTLLPPVVTKS
jgi:hypothetical protein